MVPAGVTVSEPGAPTAPIFWSISTESAFVTGPQLNTVEPNTGIILWEAVKDEMLGAPLQAVGADVFVGLDAADAPRTVILTMTLVPNTLPLGLRRRHVPECAPGATGAAIATSKSAVPS